MLESDNKGHKAVLGFHAEAEGRDTKKNEDEGEGRIAPYAWIYQ